MVVQGIVVISAVCCSLLLLLPVVSVEGLMRDDDEDELILTLTSNDICDTHLSCKFCCKEQLHLMVLHMLFLTTGYCIICFLRKGSVCTGSRFHSMDTNKEFKSQIAVSSLRRQATQRASWPRVNPTCVWCPLNNLCHDKTVASSCQKDPTADNTSMGIQYQFDCPLAPFPYPDQPPALLPDWMGALSKATGGIYRLTDLSLPGTHDSCSYDLSLTVSDDGIDQYNALADLLHVLSPHLLPGDLEEFSRLQSKTQQLTITQQLDNGIRFIDFRLMMEHSSQEWYSIHFMQSRQYVGSYWKEIRAWMDRHPQEIVVLWLSKHGSTSDTGNAQYPGVSPGAKRVLWKHFLDIFDGILLDTRESSIHETSVATLVERNHRFVVYASDYEEFTDQSPFALDAQNIQNTWFGGVGAFDEIHSYSSYKQYLDHGKSNNNDIQSKKGFTIMAMNMEGQGWQLETAAMSRFLPWSTSTNSCAKNVNIPGVTTWCPGTLLDIAQLSAYYIQRVLEEAWQGLESNPEIAFPNAFYLDALDFNGTLRTGTQLLNGQERASPYAPNKATTYGYVDLILAYNVRLVCKGHDGNLSCQELTKLSEQRRTEHAMKRWDEPELGRHVDWPP
jgi:hypothetical protein